MSDKQSTDTAKDKDSKLKLARDVFRRCKDADDHNRETAIGDIRFGRLGEQWPADIEEQRKRESRPCLTINRMPSFIRQVVNDARQNKPSIKVHPADSGADPETAEVINGLIRNIEYTSDADVAYDTGVESAVSGGFGYWRVNIEAAYDDSFDLDLKIERISNPLSVYGDPNSTAADSSDWNDAFITEVLSNEEFKYRYPKAEHRDWDEDDAWQDADDWHDNGILVAEWWHREQTDKVIFKTTDGQVISQEQIDGDEDIQAGLEMGSIVLATGKDGKPLSRTVKSHKVTQYIMSGLEILETHEWPGCYIPIVPVYGDEIVINGKRYFRSLIHDAIDAARMFNYWRTTSTELVALAPRVPFIGPEGAFDVEPEKWASINTKSHSYVEYAKDAIAAPQRQPLDVGPAAGAMQEAMLASDDMKSIMGLFDASLGARSNETSGRAILARQREGDVSTFHFLDNLARAIRHTGRILLNLIPYIYNEERIIRVLGEDGGEETRQINKPYQKMDDKTGQPVMQTMRGENGQEIEQAVIAIHDLTSGKYDLTVTTGPSFTTRREEAAFQMTELVRAFPQAAPYIADIMARNFDWPGADEIAKRFKALVPQNARDGLPPEVMQQIQEGLQKIADLEKENQELKADVQTDRTKVENEKQLGYMRVDMQRELGFAEIRLKGQLEAAKNDSMEVPGENGETEIRSKTDVGFEQMQMALAGLMQQVSAQGQMLEKMIEIDLAPVEPITDPKTNRIIGARKVLSNGAMN